MCSIEHATPSPVRRSAELSRRAARPSAQGWPVSAPSLAALHDLGMTQDQIAAYFRVPAEEVASLRQRYAIAD